MKSLIISIVFVLCIQFVQSQELKTVNLEQCHEYANNNYPVANNKGLLSQSAGLKIQNIKKRYLPELNLSAKVSYQSDVPEIGFEIPNLPSFDIPSAPKDQYGLSLDINQLIYDGGRGKALEKLEEDGLSVGIQSLEVEMYKLKSRINDIYFSILALKKNIELLEIKKEEIKEKLKSVMSAVKNGMILKSNESFILAELLSIDQNLIELISAKEGATGMLSELTGKEISPDAEFILPEVQIKKNEYFLRPEYSLFDLKEEQIESGKKLIEKQKMPVVGGFGQFGYGNPGLNMLNDGFDTYFIIGAKISWNIFDWKNNSREVNTFDIKKEMLGNQRKTFSLNQQTKLNSELSAINKFEEMLILDEKIIIERELIKKSGSSQLEQGIITSADYIAFLNAEIQARINKEFHGIQLIQAKINYNNTYGE